MGSGRTEARSDWSAAGSLTLFQGSGESAEMCQWRVRREKLCVVEDLPSGEECDDRDLHFGSRCNEMFFEE